MSANNIKFIPSPNYDNSAYRAKIDRIIIHSTEGSYSSAIDWLCRPNGNSSCHYIISEDGSDITQIVKDENVAWHAGNYNYNQRALGIENAGFASKGFQHSQVVTCAKLIAKLADKYKIPVDREHIIAHGEVPPPNDHTDPGPKWPWEEFINLILEDLNGPAKPAFEVISVKYQVVPRSGVKILTVRKGPGRGYDAIKNLKVGAGNEYPVVGEAHGDAIPDNRQQSGVDDVWCKIDELGGFVSRSALEIILPTVGGNL